MIENGSGKTSDKRGLGGGAIASLVGVGCLVTFMLQNTEDVRLDFLVWHFTWPLWLVTVLVVAAAAYVGLVLGGYLRVPPALEGLADWWWSTW